MMSVPAINPVLPSSGNQPPKVGSGSSSSVSPIGLTVQQKMSVIPQSIPTSPNKSPLSVNHAPGPLSLVHENKISASQAQASLAKSSDKPKDLSPVKPTSNGVETGGAAAKASSPTQASQGNAPTTTDKPIVENVANHENAKTETMTTTTATTTTTTTTTTAVKDETQTGKSESDETANQTKDESKGNDETPNVTEDGAKPTRTDSKATSGPNKRKREQKFDENKKGEDEPVPEKKPQRIRSQVLPYQSPSPELATCITKSLKEKDASQKSSDEKLIVFYKNEFLAVRNAENGFYLCQTLQNVYRTSHRIRIRWLSQDKDSNTVYTPDFYDFTDFECILTTVGLEKLDKNKYKLPQIELERTENILKRALDVEKGVSEKPSVTEEHPDGIDLSLYKDESQLQKPKKRKSTSPAKRSTKQPKKSDKDESHGGEEGGGEESGEETKKKKKKRSKSRGKKDKKSGKAKAKAKLGKKGKGDSSGGREKSTKAVDQLKVSPPNEKARVVAKVLRKADMTPSSSKKSKGKATKSNSRKGDKKSAKTEKSSTAGAAAAAASATTTTATTTTTTNRNSERRGVTNATSRKKTVKK